MNFDKLLDKIEDIDYWQEQYAGKTFMKAVWAVVVLHSPFEIPEEYQNQDTTLRKIACSICSTEMYQPYPCPTIEAIEKVLI